MSISQILSVRFNINNRLTKYDPDPAIKKLILSMGIPAFVNILRYSSWHNMKKNKRARPNGMGPRMTGTSVKMI